MEPDRFMIRLTRANDDFTPITKQNGDVIFSKLEMRLIEVGQWEDATFKIDRQDFEKYLDKNSDLQNYYIEMYSKSDRFFVSEMEIENYIFEFYILIKNERIALIYFKKIPADQSRFA